jgi:hypothetical protein
MVKAFGSPRLSHDGRGFFVFGGLTHLAHTGIRHQSSSPPHFPAPRLLSVIESEMAFFFDRFSPVALEGTICAEAMLYEIS